MNPLFGQGGTDRFRRAVEEKFGFKVDENLNLHRVEASSDTIPLIIPRPPADLPGNISQEEVVEWLWQRQPDVNLRGACGVDLYVSVVGRAWTEPGFIAQLKSNPEDVLNTGWGVQLPVEGKVSILTEDEENVYFVCPNDSIEGELDDDVLELVSGGVVSVFTLGMFLVFFSGLTIGGLVTAGVGAAWIGSSVIDANAK